MAKNVYFSIKQPLSRHINLAKFSKNVRIYGFRGDSEKHENYIYGLGNFWGTLRLDHKPHYLGPPQAGLQKFGRHVVGTFVVAQFNECVFYFTPCRRGGPQVVGFMI